MVIKIEMWMHGFQYCFVWSSWSLCNIQIFSFQVFQRETERKKRMQKNKRMLHSKKKCMHKIFIYVCFYHDVQVMEPEYKKLKKFQCVKKCWMATALFNILCNH